MRKDKEIANPMYKDKEAPKPTKGATPVPNEGATPPEEESTPNEGK